MLDVTLEVLKAGLKADPSLTPEDRNRLLALLRSGGVPPTRPQAAPETTRIIRRAEAARRLGISVRTLDKLAREGVVAKVRLPNRTRAGGFRESDITSLISAGGTERRGA